MHRKPTTMARLAARSRRTLLHLSRTARVVRPVALDAAGLTLLAAAAAAVALPAGLAVAGLGCLLLNWRLQGA